VRLRPGDTAWWRRIARRATDVAGTGGLTLTAVRRFVLGMDLTPEEMTFVRDLVKASRQRIHPVKWLDRDGSDRQTMLTQAEAVRLNVIAHRLAVSKGELLRQAAHVPNAKV
jgi:hypothetical protein